MGREQRSRRFLPEGTRCYLCGHVIDATRDKWNRDHVPPKRIFASELRQEHDLTLKWLPTHIPCNSDFRGDEEYFVVSFAGHVGSKAAQAVMRDLKDAATKGHDHGLLRDVIGRFGRIVGPNGEVLYEYDTNRVKRFAWKVVRGLYYLELGGVLPEKTLGDIFIVNPVRPPDDLANLGWFATVRDIEPMGQYGAVFDYKWLGWKDGEIRAHAFAMLIWDGLIITTLFHDPRCDCATCIQRARHQRE